MDESNTGMEQEEVLHVLIWDGLVNDSYSLIASPNINTDSPCVQRDKLHELTFPGSFLCYRSSMKRLRHGLSSWAD